ncbi:MAG TPA: formyltransferase family protein [Gemmatimonadaceae bacterium]|nr:formyltransferase family protein [Gemmatimonadaceae bacterium]
MDPSSSPSTLSALRKLARIAFDARAWRPSHARVLLGEIVGKDRNAAAGYTDHDHLMAAAQWLAQAQDAMSDGGVAGRFSLRTGWTSSYPETTGYLIPTFLELAKEPGLAGFNERAARAMDFLLRLQLSSGAFPGGEVAENTTSPSVFNSAQIICGLVAWHRATNDQRALHAAVRAANWLLEVQDADGVWRRHIYGDAPTAYSAHASCWLAELGAYVGEQRYLDGARRHLHWLLGLADAETGWFDRAGFSTQDHAARVSVTHTIAYTIWGVLMTSELLGDSNGIASAEKAALGVARRLELDRGLPGLLDWRWRGRGTYACVTGSAQMALIWLRMYERSRDARLINSALLAIDTVKRSQAMRTGLKETRGGLPGSDPVWGDYIHLEYPNWAAKFFIDALLGKRRALMLLDQREPITWSPPPAIARPDAGRAAGARIGAPRVVLYSAEESVKVSQLLAVCGSWGFRPLAVVVEHRRDAPVLARMRERLRRDGFRGAWQAFARRFGRGRPRETAALDHSTRTRAVCVREGIPLVEVESLSDEAGVTAVRELQPDIAVHAGAGILRRDLLMVPRIGTLNAHMGVLPRYRGMNVAEWAALEGGPVGCSVHFIDAGIDTGPVLAIRQVDPRSTRSVEELRALVDEQQITLLGDVLRIFCESGPKALTPYAQAPEEGLQFFRMHAELRGTLERGLAPTG